MSGKSRNVKRLAVAGGAASLLLAVAVTSSVATASAATDEVTTVGSITLCSDGDFASFARFPQLPISRSPTISAGSCGTFTANVSGDRLVSIIGVKNDASGYFTVDSFTLTGGAHANVDVYGTATGDHWIVRS
jgi:hypothetical protein